MNKFKIWLRNKLKSYLKIDKLENDYKKLINDHEKLMIEFNDYKIKNDYSVENINKDVSNNTYAINTLHTTIENVVHIGTDVRQYNGEHSWAVICIEGKMNIVKFIDLNGRYARDILDFLKQFEAGRHCIDTPSSPMFYSELFKF